MPGVVIFAVKMLKNAVRCVKIRTMLNNPMLKAFLAKAKKKHGQPVKVLRSTTYKIGKAHVLVRTSTKSASNLSRPYFFGLQYTAIEELANLKNPFLALVCGKAGTLMIPASEIFNNLEHMSVRRDGNYRIQVDAKFNLALKGQGNRLTCRKYIDKWNFFGNPPLLKGKTTPAAASLEESLHAVLQGRLIEIGNKRGFYTFCPDKKKTFNGRKLSEISTLKRCPELQFSDHKLLSKIDVLWFNLRGKHYIPKCAFEVELTTGTWPGIMRMRSLLDYGCVKLYIVSSDGKKYKQAMETMPEHRDRYVYLPEDSLSELYSAEKSLITLRKEIGL